MACDLDYFLVLSCINGGQIKKTQSLSRIHFWVLEGVFWKGRYHSENLKKIYILFFFVCFVLIQSPLVLSSIPLALRQEMAQSCNSQVESHKSKVTTHLKI